MKHFCCIRKCREHCQLIIKTKLMKQRLEMRSFENCPLLTFEDIFPYQDWKTDD